MRILLLFCLVFIGFFSADSASAQFDAGQFGSFEPKIELNPKFPQPGETVVATVSQYGGALYGSTLTWVFKGEEVPNSKNQRSVEIVAGEAGVTETIDVVFTTPTGNRSFVSKSITPIWLDIVIEPQTHVPEFYQGRALPSLGSTVVARAIISSEDYSPGSLIYNWSINDQSIGGGSVRGQSIVSYETPMGDSAVLSLEVSDLKGNMIAGKYISIPSVQPKILFYEVNTLLGIKNKPIINQLQLVGKSTIVRAEPINMDSKIYNEPDIHEWSINNRVAPASGGNPYEVVLEKTGSSGYANLEFHVRSLSQVLQGGKASIGINL